MSFGEQAAHLAGIASQLLSWRPDEFWNSTPAELALALQLPKLVDGPDGATIDALKLRFPDD